MDRIGEAAQVKAVVRSNTEIAPAHFEMTLEAQGAFRRPEAGQFVMVRIADGEVFLPRPFSVCCWEKAVSPRRYPAAAKERTTDLAMISRPISSRIILRLVSRQ